MTAPAMNTCLNFRTKEKTVTGRNAKIENGQPKMTPTAATATAIAGLSRRNNPDDREMAYIENELGKKPGKQYKENGHKLIPRVKGTWNDLLSYEWMNGRTQSRKVSHDNFKNEHLRNTKENPDRMTGKTLKWKF